MSWNEIEKKTTRFSQEQGEVDVYRGNFGDYNTRGEISNVIHGSLTAEVTRSEMEDYFGTREANIFTEISKNTANWSEI